MGRLQLNSFEVRRLFFDASSTRYLNAYLLSREGKRTLPVPLSWFKDKDAQLPEPGSLRYMPIYDRSIVDELPDEFTPKRVEQEFCTIDGNLTTPRRPEELFPECKFPELRSHTFQQCRAFGEKAEVMLWKVDQDWKARLIKDDNKPECLPDEHE